MNNQNGNDEEKKPDLPPQISSRELLFGSSPPPSPMPGSDRPAVDWPEVSPPEARSGEPADLGGDSATRLASMLQDISGGAVPPPQPKRRFSRRVFFFGVGVVALVFLGVGGVFAYQQILVRPPKEVVRLALERFLDAPSYAFSGEFSGSFAYGEGTARVTVSYSGARKSEGEDERVSLEGLMTATIPEGVLGPGGTQDLSFSFALRSFGSKRAYVKLDQLKLPSELEELLAVEPVFAGLLERVSGKWIFIDQEALKQYQTEALGTEPEDALTSEGLKLTKEERARILDLFVEALLLEKKKGSESIDGVGTYHYAAKLDPAGVRALLNELVKIWGGKAGTAMFENTMQDSDFDRAFQKFVNALSLDAWIGKRDLLPRKISSSLLLQNEETRGTTEITLSNTTHYAHFSEPVDIAEPENFIPFTDVLEGMLAVSQARARDAQRIADLQQLVAALEQYRTRTGFYPNTLNLLAQINPATIEAGAPCLQLVSEGLLYVCPTDPAGGSAFYGFRSDGKAFELSAALENPACNTLESVREGNLCIYRLQSRR